MEGKAELLRTFELSLLDDFSPTQINLISTKLQVALSNYDLVQIERAIVVYDFGNEEILTNFMACMLLQGKSKGTIKMYCREVKKLYEFKGKNLKDISTQDIKEYLASLLVRGVSKRTTANSRNYISSFYRWLYEDGYIAKNPCETLHAVKFEKEIKPAFTDIEIDKMRSCELSVRDRAVVEVLLSSGVRVEELCNLNRNDIDLDNLKVHVRCGKGAKDRITYISRVAAYRLNDYLSIRTDDNSALFLNYENRKAEYQDRISADGIRGILNDLGEKTNIKAHPHKFRHTFATNLYNRGMDLHEIQLLLGHNSLDTTMVYISSDNKALESSYLKHMG